MLFGVRGVSGAPAFKVFDHRTDGECCKDCAFSDPFESLEQDQRHDRCDDHQGPVHDLFHSAVADSGDLRECHDETLTGQIDQLGLDLDIHPETENDRSDSGHDPLGHVVLRLDPAGQVKRKIHERAKDHRNRQLEQL